tara:strand:- start:694 stop:1536 length:843 start_codon:yes stop_codon:yes gene_type:complete
MNINDAIYKGKCVLEKNFIKNSQLDSEILMSKVFNKDRKFVILNSKNKLDKEKFSFFNDLITERSKGKPIAYILNKKDFWKYEFKVEKDVLIPRPDTEILVEQALKFTKNKINLRVLDIGTGSGCILLSILKEKKNFYGVGVDISKKCINLSKTNAFKLGIKNRLKLFNSSIDNFRYGKYDLIISNPPYINKLDFKYLNKDVVNFEPKSALYGGLDGTSEIRKVIKRSSELIKKNGKLILEIGFDQKKKVTKLLNHNGFYIDKIFKDLAKNDRCIVSTKI